MRPSLPWAVDAGEAGCIRYSASKSTRYRRSRDALPPLMTWRHIRSDVTHSCVDIMHKNLKYEKMPSIELFLPIDSSKSVASGS